MVSRFSALIIIALLFSLYGFLAYKAYGAEPETQQIIDNANALDTKVQALATQLSTPKVFYFGSDKIPTATINGIAVPAIPCTGTPEIDIPIDKQQNYPYCYKIQYQEVLAAP